MARDPKVLNEVKETLALLAQAYPGKAIEVRIPPYAAVQCGDGPKHTRGTPPNVVEMQAETLFRLAQGENIWKSSIENGAIHASGERSDLESLFQDLAIRMHP